MKFSFARSKAIFLASSVIIGIAAWLGISGEVNLAQRKTVERKFDVPAKYLRPDAVTRSIRDISTSLFRVSVRSPSDRSKAEKLGKIVSDHGNFVIVSANSSVRPERFGEGTTKFDSEIHLPGAVFDPVSSPPAETVHAGAPAKYGKGYFVAQLGDIATDEVLDSIRGMGFDVLQYVPNNAFFVYGDSENAPTLAGHSRVRWVGEYTPQQKVATDIFETANISKDGTALYNIAVFSRADLDQAAFEIISASSGTLLSKMELHSSFFNVVRVAMNPAQIAIVASVADVVRIDSYVKPTREDERAAHIVAGNYTTTTALAAPGYNPLTQFGVDGTNVTVAVSDDGVSIPGNGGFYLTSANTVDANLRGSTSGADGGHGHINASIIAGAAPFGSLDTLGYNYSLGVAPKSNILNIPFLKLGYPDDDTLPPNDAVSTPGPNGVNATISNNSWGNGTNSNVYESLAALYDSLARDASAAGSVDPLLFVFSAGNSGASGLTRPKMAKNVIAVANSENLRPELSSAANNIDDISSSSSRGPAADGRIKPDITAPGTVITGSRAGNCSSVSFCFDANHACSSGTSHAAPQIAGVAALFTEYWKSTHAGANPSIAITKAAILQTGQEMNGVGTASPIPNGAEGWGRVNTSFMLNTGVPMKYVDQSVNFLSPGDNVVFTGRVVDGTKPFRATLVWTDPAGVADPALVNDLDLTLTINGVTYRGNNFSGGTSVSGGSSDVRNNVEHVWQTGLAADTPISITVNASALNGDGIIGNGDATDQHFALVVYNFVDAALTNFGISGRVVDQTGRGVPNATVVLSNGGVAAVARTGSFGYYSFFNIPGSANYTASVSSKRYTFAPQMVNLGTTDLTGINFTATGGSP
ncbi:MAG: S8 family serine peptidase [Pyrinomonadaceae bacterium]